MLCHHFWPLQASKKTPPWWKYSYACILLNVKKGIKSNGSVKPWQHALDRDEGLPPPSQSGNQFGVIRNQRVPTRSKGCFKFRHGHIPIYLVLFVLIPGSWLRNLVVKTGDLANLGSAFKDSKIITHRVCAQPSQALIGQAKLGPGDGLTQLWAQPEAGWCGRTCST